MIVKPFIRTILLGILCGAFQLVSAQPAFETRAPKETEKVKAALSVLNELSQMKERIPERLLAISQGIIIVPKMVNGGFVIGGKHGKGLALVKNEQGQWSDPVFVTLTGGSFGLQAGVQAVDLILVFKNNKTLLEMSKGSFTLGGDLSVAAGPVGRSSSASTDYKLEAEVYSYSRSKGFFAGLTLNGVALSVDQKANREFYEEFDPTGHLFSTFNNSSGEVQDLKAALIKLE